MLSQEKMKIKLKIGRTQYQSLNCFLNYRKLYLNRKGNSYLENNIMDYLNTACQEKPVSVSSSSNVSAIKG